MTMTVRIVGNSASRRSIAGTAMLKAGSRRGRWARRRSGTAQVEDVAVEDHQPVDLAVRMVGDGHGELTRQNGVDLDGGNL